MKAGVLQKLVCLTSDSFSSWNPCDLFVEIWGSAENSLRNTDLKE
jgi:hypothetical protein